MPAPPGPTERGALAAAGLAPLAAAPSRRPASKFVRLPGRGLGAGGTGDREREERLDTRRAGSLLPPEPRASPNRWAGRELLLKRMLQQRR